MDKNKPQKLTTEEALNPRQDYGRVRLSMLSPGSLVEMGDSRIYSSYQQATLNGQPKKSNTNNERRSHLLNNECCNKYCISMYNTASAGARPMLSIHSISRGQATALIQSKSTDKKHTISGSGEPSGPSCCDLRFCQNQFNTCI